jgi:hypothetical protein
VPDSSPIPPTVKAKQTAEIRQYVSSSSSTAKTTTTTTIAFHIRLYKVAEMQHSEQ